MQGHWTLLHVIGLVVWWKLVFFLLPGQIAFSQHPPISDVYGNTQQRSLAAASATSEKD